MVPVDGQRCGGMGAGGARMLVGVCAVSVVSVCAVSVLCSVDGVYTWWGFRVGMSRGRFSWLVEQEFEEVGLVCWGQGCRMLQVFVGAVCELLCRLGNGRPLHVCRRGLRVLPVGA